MHRSARFTGSFGRQVTSRALARLREEIRLQTEARKLEISADAEVHIHRVRSVGCIVRHSVFESVKNELYLEAVSGLLGRSGPAAALTHTGNLGIFELVTDATEQVSR